LQAGGRRFDPDQLHHFSSDDRSGPPAARTNETLETATTAVTAGGPAVSTNTLCSALVFATAEFL
jgi:hypothetical protein